MLDAILQFLADSIPAFQHLITYGPLLLLYTLVAAAFISWLKKRYQVKTPYTRKVFHFLIFAGAGGMQLLIGLSGVFLLGVIVSFFVFYAVIRGSGNFFYEALARPTDAPHRTLFVLIPWFTTALGGVIVNIWSPEYAHIAYWVAGFGDAIGEPVGTRWGYHPYKVPSMAGVKATRTLEGSAAVVLVSTVVMVGGLSAGSSLPGVVLGLVSLAGGVGVGLIEAISNYGTDNLTIQVGAVGLLEVMMAYIHGVHAFTF